MPKGSSGISASSTSCSSSQPISSTGFLASSVRPRSVWVADFAKAQALLDEQVATDWSKTLAELLQEVHPAFASLRSELQLRDYYWTAEQTEVATDVAFRSEKTLAPLYRRLLRHAMENLSSGGVMRFLQQRLTKSGSVRRNFAGELVSDLQVRREGTRVKHRLGANSVKMYDKFGVILRVETTIHEAEGLKRKPIRLGLISRELLQLRAHFLRGEVAIPTRRLQLGIDVGVRLDDAADVRGQLRIGLFESGASAGGKVFDASNLRAAFVLTECDGVSSASESSFGSARTTTAESVGDLRLKASSLMSGEGLGRESEQVVGCSCGVVHDSASERRNG